MTFHAPPSSETTSTPTRVRQFLKKGVVKFQEVRQAVPVCMIAEPFMNLYGSTHCDRK